MYSYANNSPATFTDHTGLFSWSRAAGGFVRGLALAGITATAAVGFTTLFPAAAAGLAVIGAAAVGVGIGAGLYEAFTGREHKWDGSGAVLSEGDYSESVGNTASLVVSSGGLFHPRSPLLSEKPCTDPPTIWDSDPMLPFRSPAALKDMPASQVRDYYKSQPGWETGLLGKGSNEGLGLTVRKLGPNGEYADGYVQWHPGSRHHFDYAPYWKVKMGGGPTTAIDARFPTEGGW